MRFNIRPDVAMNEDEAADHIRKNAYPLNDDHDLEPLLRLIGNARIVMLGEASHGTHEYYTWCSRISKRLI